MLDLAPRCPHGNAQRLGFVRAGNRATVVVAEYHHRATIQAWAKYPLAAHKKVVSIHQRIHSTPLDRKLFDGGGHHAPNFDGLPFFGHDVRVSGIGGFELDPTCPLVKVLHGEIAVYDGNHDMVVTGFDGAVHHQNVV